MAISPGGRPADASPVGTPGGRQNWVDKAGGLPRYVRMVAHALMRKGMSKDHAIPAAVNRLKRWAAGLDNVTPKVQAAAKAAIAEWVAKHTGAGLALSTPAEYDLASTVYPTIPRLDLLFELVALDEHATDLSTDAAEYLDLAARDYVRDQVGKFARDGRRDSQRTEKMGVRRDAGDKGKGKAQHVPTGPKDPNAYDLSSLSKIRKVMRDWPNVPFGTRATLRGKLIAQARKLGASDRLMALANGLGNGVNGAEKGEGAGNALASGKASAWLKQHGFKFSDDDPAAELALDLAAEVVDTLDLAPGDYSPPYDWKHGFIPLTPAAALSKAKKGPHAGKGRSKAPKGARLAGKAARSAPGPKRTVAGKKVASSKAPTPRELQAAADDLGDAADTRIREIGGGNGSLSTLTPAQGRRLIAEAKADKAARAAKAADDEKRGRGVPGDLERARGSVLTTPAPKSSPEAQRKAVKSNQGPGDSPLSGDQLRKIANDESKSDAVRKAARTELAKRGETPGASVTSLDSRRTKGPDATPPKVPNGGLLKEGARVKTEYGNGVVVESTDRSVTIQLPNGEKINVQRGTPGFGRLEQQDGPMGSGASEYAARLVREHKAAKNNATPPKVSDADPIGSQKARAAAEQAAQESAAGKPRVNLPGGGSYPVKSDGSPDYGAMSAEQAATIRAKERGLGVGAHVDTDQGPGVVKSVTSRGTNIELDAVRPGREPDVIHVVAGTPGDSRLKPRTSAGRRAGAQVPNAEPKPGDQGSTAMSGKSRPRKVSDAEREAAQKRADEVTAETFKGKSTDQLKRAAAQHRAAGRTRTAEGYEREVQRRRDAGQVPGNTPEWRNRRDQAARGTLEPSAADMTWAAEEWKRRNPDKKMAGHEDEVNKLARARAQDKSDRGLPSTSDAERASERARVKKATSEPQRTAKRLADEKNARGSVLDTPAPTSSPEAQRAAVKTNVTAEDRRKLEAAKAKAAGLSAGASTPGGIDELAARRMTDDQLERAMARLMESGTYDGPAFAIIEKELDRRDKARRAEGNGRRR